MSWRERIAGMIEIVSDLVMDSDGKTASKGADDHELDSQAGWHFGFYSRPKDNARGVVLKADGQGNTSFLICWRDKQYEMTLEKGEVGIQNAFEAKILLDKNGDIIQTPKSGRKVYVGGSSGTEPAVLGDSLQTRLADLESKFLAHVHTNGTLTSPSGNVTGAMDTASVSGSSLTHSSDNIKASVARVK